MALTGIPISDDDCIGDSLDTINDSFITLDSRTINLSSDLSFLNTTVVALSVTGGLAQKTKHTGDGIETDFAVHGTYTNAALYRVDLNGVVQEPTVGASVGDYSISTPGTITFSTAPGTGVKIVVIG
jgi:hypothetical protein